MFTFVDIRLFICVSQDGNGFVDTKEKLQKVIDAVKAAK